MKRAAGFAFAGALRAAAVALCLGAVAGCASTPSGQAAWRAERDAALDKGEFLVAVERSRQLYREAGAAPADCHRALRVGRGHRTVRRSP
ncbi:MAG: hypothetical protein JNL30_09445 [Rubrivivax sp.]|nr:hypothetical protein [Rubrivivax sp.]